MYILGQSLRDCGPLCCLFAEMILQDDMFALIGLRYTQAEIRKLRKYHRQMVVSGINEGRISYSSSRNATSNFIPFNEAENAEIDEIELGPQKTPKRTQKRRHEIPSSSPIKKRKIDLNSFVALVVKINLL